MRIRLDRDLCDSHGLCAATCPEVFEINDDDEMQIKNAQPPADLHDKVEAAVRRCPKAALSLSD